MDVDKTYTRSDVKTMLSLFGGMIIAAAEVPDEAQRDESSVANGEIVTRIQVARTIAEQLYSEIGEDRNSCYTSAGVYALQDMADVFISYMDKRGHEYFDMVERTARVIEEAIGQK